MEKRAPKPWLQLSISEELVVEIRTTHLLSQIQSKNDNSRNEKPIKLRRNVPLLFQVATKC